VGSGIFASEHEGPSEVTVEDGADLVCSGNNTGNRHEVSMARSAIRGPGRLSEGQVDYLTARGGTIAGVAEENTLSADGADLVRIGE